MFEKITIIVLSLFFAQVLFLKVSFANLDGDYFGSYDFGPVEGSIEIGGGFAPEAPAIPMLPVQGPEWDLDISVNPDEGTFEFLPISGIERVEIPTQTSSDTVETETDDGTSIEMGAEGTSSGDDDEPTVPGVDFAIEEQHLSIGNVDVRVGGNLVVSHSPDGSVTGFSEVALTSDAEMALSGDTVLGLSLDSEGNVTGNITANGEIIDSATLSVSQDKDGTWQISGVEGTYIIDRWFEGVFELGSAGDWRVTAGDHLPEEEAAAGGSGDGDEGLGGSSLFSEFEDSLDETVGGMSKDEVLDVIGDVADGLVPDETEDEKTEGLDFPVDGWFLELTPQQQRLAVECIKERLAVELSTQGFDINEIKLHIGMAEGIDEDGEPVALMSLGLTRRTDSGDSILGQTYLDISKGNFNMHVDGRDGITGGVEYEHENGASLELQGISLHGISPVTTGSGEVGDNVSLSVPLCLFGVDTSSDVTGNLGANPAGVQLGIRAGEDNFWNFSFMEGMLGFSASAVDSETGLKQTVVVGPEEWEWRVSLGEGSSESK